VIADTQTRVFLLARRPKDILVYPTTSCTTVFKRYTLILPDPPDTYLFLLFTIPWILLTILREIDIEQTSLKAPQQHYEPGSDSTDIFADESDDEVGIL